MWPISLLVVIAALWDFQTRRIPNWLVGPFLFLGIALSLYFHGWSGLGHSVLGVLMAGMILGILYWLRAMGMGDVKLFAAIGAWIWPEQLTTALTATALAGGVLAVIWAIRGGFLKESFAGAGDLLAGFVKRGVRPHKTLALSNPGARKMPYAPAIAIGTIFSFFAS